MPRVSAMPRPALPLVGLELIPALQGGGADGSVGLPILSIGAPFGGQVLVMRAPMLADLSATADADPGAASVRWNHATPTSATQIFIDDVDDEADDVSAALATLAAGGFLYLQACATSEDRDRYQKWQVTSVTDAIGYTKLAVTLQSSNGTFADDEPLELIVQQPPPSPGTNRDVLTTVASSGGTLTYDLSLGDYFQTTLNENVATLSLTNVPTVCTVGFWLTQDSTARTFAWPASFNWGDGKTAVAMPTASGKVLFVIASTKNAGGTWDVAARVRA